MHFYGMYYIVSVFMGTIWKVIVNFHNKYTIKAMSYYLYYDGYCQENYKLGEIEKKCLTIIIVSLESDQ